jgi:nicotinate-nucleotide pyrophosphorylase (carboxylating)
MTTRSLPDYARADIARVVAFALQEDIGDGDITAQLIPESAQAQATIVTREDAVMCGAPWAEEVFRQLGGVDVQWHAGEGERLAAGTVFCTLSGNTRRILTGERTALNFLQTLMATATSARRYADAVAGTTVTVLDTRKTLPGLRAAQKYAVLCGLVRRFSDQGKPHYRLWVDHRRHRAGPPCRRQQENHHRGGKSG